jgi:hypothetical protein
LTLLAKTFRICGDLEVATAIVAAIGNGAAFRKGREFAAWLGVVPGSGEQWNSEPT